MPVSPAAQKNALWAVLMGKLKNSPITSLLGGYLMGTAVMPEDVPMGGFISKGLGYPTIGGMAIAKNVAPEAHMAYAKAVLENPKVAAMGAVLPALLGGNFKSFMEKIPAGAEIAGELFRLPAMKASRDDQVESEKEMQGKPISIK